MGVFVTGVLVISYLLVIIVNFKSIISDYVVNSTQ